MSEKASDDGGVHRRSFLKVAATGAAALVVNTRAEAQQTRPGTAGVLPPSAPQLARDAFPSTRMPSHSEGTSSDADARDVLAYVRTLDLDAPPVEDSASSRSILESAARSR